jgi:hypothetical protein
MFSKTKIALSTTLVLSTAIQALAASKHHRLCFFNDSASADDGRCCEDYVPTILAWPGWR